MLELRNENPAAGPADARDLRAQYLKECFLAVLAQIGAKRDRFAEFLSPGHHHADDAHRWA